MRQQRALDLSRTDQTTRAIRHLSPKFERATEHSVTVQGRRHGDRRESLC
jgi:hypothetical protein